MNSASALPLTFSADGVVQKRCATKVACAATTTGIRFKYIYTLDRFNPFEVALFTYTRAVKSYVLPM